MDQRLRLLAGLFPLFVAAVVVVVLIVFTIVFLRRSKADAALVRPFSADPQTFAEYSYGRIRERYLEALKQTSSIHALAIVLSVVAVLMAAGGLDLLDDPERNRTAILAFLLSGLGVGVLAVLAFVQATVNRRHLAVIIEAIRIDWRLKEAVRIAEGVSEPDVRTRLLAVLSLQLIGTVPTPVAVREVVGRKASTPAVPTVYGWRAYFRRSARRGRRRIELERDYFRRLR